VFYEQLYDADDDVFRLTAAILAAAVVVYNVHVFWTISLYHDDTSPTCDASDDNYFMMHVFEYLKLISYCVVPFVIVLILNVCIIVRLRQASPLQSCEAVSVTSSTNTTPRHSVVRRSRRYFFADRLTTTERLVPPNAVDNEDPDSPNSPSRREVMSKPWDSVGHSGAHPGRQHWFNSVLCHISSEKTVIIYIAFPGRREVMCWSVEWSSKWSSQTQLSSLRTGWDETQVSSWSS